MPYQCQNHARIIPPEDLLDAVPDIYSETHHHTRNSKEKTFDDQEGRAFIIITSNWGRNIRIHKNCASSLEAFLQKKRLDVFNASAVNDLMQARLLSIHN